MFELSRRCAESVIIDGFNTPERAIRVTVIEIKDGKVRLGFDVNRDASLNWAEEKERVRAKPRINRSNGGA